MPASMAGRLHLRVTPALYTTIIKTPEMTLRTTLSHGKQLQSSELRLMERYALRNSLMPWSERCSLQRSGTPVSRPREITFSLSLADIIHKPRSVIQAARIRLPVSLLLRLFIIQRLPRRCRSVMQPTVSSQALLWMGRMIIRKSKPSTIISAKM